MCDTVVVVGPDRVFFAKNSDRDPNEAQVLEWHPARRPARGATVRCTWIEIPDELPTHAVVLSRPFWMWGAEMGSNECGVTIGNEAVFTREPYAETGLTGMDLVRLALERSDTAERAVSVIVELLERHGQGGGCGLERPSFTYHNSFLIADRVEAWVLETAGEHWAEAPVREGVRTISNGLTIAPFARQYADRVRTRVAGASARRALTSQLSPHSGPEGLMAMLRAHGRHREPHYSIVNGGLNVPCAHAGGLFAASQTTASWVSVLGEEKPRHWVTGTAAPCTGIFKPIYVDEPCDLGPEPADHDDGESLWWRHERLHRMAMFDPARTYPLFIPERDEVERQWLVDPPAAADAFARADALLQRWTPSVRGQAVVDRRPWFVRRYWRTRNRRAGLFTDRRCAAQAASS